MFNCVITFNSAEFWFAAMTCILFYSDPSGAETIQTFAKQTISNEVH